MQITISTRKLPSFHQVFQQTTSRRISLPRIDEYLNVNFDSEKQSDTLAEFNENLSLNMYPNIPSLKFLTFNNDYRRQSENVANLSLVASALNNHNMTFVPHKKDSETSDTLLLSQSNMILSPDIFSADKKALINMKNLKKRKPKLCEVEGCTKISQTKRKCKFHGGGSRCSIHNCHKSNQGNGLCRAHGGGKRCKVPSCTKGSQRHGLCHVHGGVRFCKSPGCHKKDRGNGFCVACGGGKRCFLESCNRLARKKGYCTQHFLSHHQPPEQSKEVEDQIK